MSYKARDVVEGEIPANLATFFIAAIIIFILFNFTLEDNITDSNSYLFC